MTAARCAGTTPAEGLSMAAMFDADDRETHKVARKVCNGCPMVQACIRRAVDLAHDAARDRNLSGPSGTWGGLLWRNGRVVPTQPNVLETLDLVLTADVDTLRQLIYGRAA